MTDSDGPGMAGDTDAPPPPASNWSAPPAAAAAPATAVPGAVGYVYADVLYRVVALFIDGIILAIVNIFILATVFSTLGLSIVGANLSFVGLILYAVIGAAISLAYFVFTWTRMRASVGLKVLGMQVGNAADGATLTQEQAIRRWIVLWGPGTVGQLLSNTPGIGVLLSLLGLGWMIYLLWTTYQSATKQGFHDVFAKTVVVKRATSVG